MIESQNQRNHELIRKNQDLIEQLLKDIDGAQYKYDIKN